MTIEDAAKIFGSSVASELLKRDIEGEAFEGGSASAPAHRACRLSTKALSKIEDPHSGRNL